MNLDHNLKRETQAHSICILMNVHEVIVVYQSIYLCINFIKFKCL